MEPEPPVDATSPLGLRDVVRFARRQPLDDVEPLLRRVPTWKLRLAALTLILAGGALLWLVCLLLTGSLYFANVFAGPVSGVALLASLPYLASGGHDEGSRATGAFLWLSLLARGRLGRGDD